LGFALVGYGVGTVIPIAYGIAGKSKTMRPSVALAAVSTVGFTGFLIGPPIIGFIAHEIGLRMALALVVVLGILVLMLSTRVRS
jgi:MFS family permease